MEDSNPKPPDSRPDTVGIGIGAFFVLAGVMTLAEHAGLIPASMKWGMPIIAVIIGAVVIYNSMRKRG